MRAMVSLITSPTIVYSTVYSGADQRKHQSSASLAFVRRIHRWPVNSPHKWPVTRKLFPFDEVIVNGKRFHHNSWWYITFCNIVFCEKKNFFCRYILEWPHTHAHTHIHTQTFWHNVTLTDGLYLFEGINVTITFDTEGSPEVSVLETNHSQGCEDLMNQYFREVRHASKTDDSVQDCSISSALGMEIKWDTAVMH